MIGETIRNQIRLLDKLAFTSWGAKKFVNTKNGLQFYVGGLTDFKGHVHITLTTGDYYNIELYKVTRNFGVKVVSTTEFVLNTQLVEVLDKLIFGE